MRPVARMLLPAAIIVHAPALAGPPFLTDDPEPTETGHWEIYAPLAETAGVGRSFEGAFGAELNYGAVRDVQVTLALPGSFQHDGSGWRAGRGDLAPSIKYRVYDNQAAGLQIAVFPGITIPTAGRGFGNPKVTAFLPLWMQKDIGAWTIFGGGGYAINPGAGDRDFWSGGLALTRDLGRGLLLGVEADRQGPDTLGGHGSISLGIGGIVKCGGPFRLLASGGPAFTDDQRPIGFHAFAALGIDF